MVSSPHEGLDRGDNTRAAGAGAGVSGCISTSGPSEVTVGVGTTRIRADIFNFDLKTEPVVREHRTYLYQGTLNFSIGEEDAAHVPKEKAAVTVAVERQGQTTVR